MDPEQTAPIGAVCSGSTLVASILNLSVMLGNYLQQTTSADDIFRCIFFLGALRVNSNQAKFVHLCKFYQRCKEFCCYKECQYKKFSLYVEGKHQDNGK